MKWLTVWFNLFIFQQLHHRIPLMRNSTKFTIHFVHKLQMQRLVTPVVILWYSWPKHLMPRTGFWTGKFTCAAFMLKRISGFETSFLEFRCKPRTAFAISDIRFKMFCSDDGEIESKWMHLGFRIWGSWHMSDWFNDSSERLTSLRFRLLVRLLEDGGTFEFCCSGCYEIVLSEALKKIHFDFHVNHLKND